MPCSCSALIQPRSTQPRRGRRWPTSWLRRLLSTALPSRAQRMLSPALTQTRSCQQRRRHTCQRRSPHLLWSTVLGRTWRMSWMLPDPAPTRRSPPRTPCRCLTHSHRSGSNTARSRRECTCWTQGQTRRLQQDRVCMSLTRPLPAPWSTALLDRRHTRQQMTGPLQTRRHQKGTGCMQPAQWTPAL
jgi:hypothetical protein